MLNPEDGKDAYRVDEFVEVDEEASIVVFGAVVDVVVVEDAPIQGQIFYPPLSRDVVHSETWNDQIFESCLLILILILTLTVFFWKIGYDFLDINK
jgi:hypothetical protein